MLSIVSQKWWVLLLHGLCAAALGVAAMMMPRLPLLYLAYLFAAFSLIDGAACIILGIRGEPNGTVWWTMVALGGVAIAAGIGVIAAPDLLLVMLIWIVSAAAIVRGIVTIVAAIRLRKAIDDEWLLGLAGAIAVLFGVLIFTHPTASLTAIAMLLGAYMLVEGVLAVGLSLRLRQLQRSVASGAVPA